MQEESAPPACCQAEQVSPPFQIAPQVASGATVPGRERQASRWSTARAGRWTPATIVPQVDRQAGSVLLVVRVGLLPVAAPETRKSRQELVLRSDFWPRG